MGDGKWRESKAKKQEYNERYRVKKREKREYIEPEADIQRFGCCLCRRVVSPELWVNEWRPTGIKGAMQKWRYCPDCAARVLRLGLQ